MMSKTIRTVLCSILSVVLAAGCFAAAAAGAVSFKDVQKGAWYYDAVTFAVEQGLMNGVGDGKFSPNASADRAMLVTLLYRTEGSPTVLAKTPFTDLKADWYQKSVAWAYANKIVNGLTATAYGPANQLTREQFATILYRYCKDYLELEVGGSAALSGYPDQKKVSGWAKEAMAWANAEGLITGTAKNNKVYLDPQGNATRAQMATIFQRFDGYRARLEQQAPEQELPIAPPIEQPCDFSGEPIHTYGTMGEQSKHFYLCRADGCTKTKEVPCTVQTEVSPATCKDYGSINYSCAVCGYNQTVVDPSAAPTGHQMGKAIHRESEEGEHFHTAQCQTCSYTEEGACTVTIQNEAPSCTENGGVRYTCPDCNYNEWFSDDAQQPLGHSWSVYAPCEETEGAAPAHMRRCTNAGCGSTEKGNCTVRTETKAATCVEHRKTVESCATCGYSKETVDVNSPLGSHSFTAPPRHTAGEQGSNCAHTYTCANGCGATQNENCTVTTTKTMAAPGKNGTVNYACKKCDYKESVSNPYAPALPYEEGAYKVITYNLKAMYYDPLTGGTKDQRENVVELLKLFDADIIGLQEVDNINSRSWYCDQAKYLADALGYEYYFCETLEWTSGGKVFRYGTAILSRYPIKTAEQFDFAVQSGEERAYSRAVIKFPESDVVFYNTHLCTNSSGSTTGAAAQQFEEVIGAVCTETLPTLLTGDFNLLHNVREQLYDKSKVMSLNAVNYDSALPIDDIYIRNAEYFVDSQSGRGLFLVRENYSDHEMAYGCFKLK